MNVGKACVAVTAPKHNHFITDEIGCVVSFSLRFVSGRHPFVPTRLVMVRDVERPHVIQSRLAVTSTKDDEISLISDRGVRAARWRKRLGHLGTVESMRY